jgi:hypothetical protein
LQRKLNAVCLIIGFVVLICSAVLGGGLSAASLGCILGFIMNISKEEFYSLVNPLVGMKISKVWRGYGSALFLELGKLTKKSLTLRNSNIKEYYEGKHSLFVGYGWRVERISSIYFGSWSTNKIIENRFPKLNRKTILEFDIEGRLPELRIKLSDGLWIHSFCTTENQPEWYLKLNSEKPTYNLIQIQRGKIVEKLVINKTT